MLNDDFTKKGSFIDNLPKVYGMYTGGFLVFVVLMAILEQMGVGAETIGILFVCIYYRHLCRYRLVLADHAGRCLLCSGPTGTSGIQWYGDSG